MPKTKYKRRSDGRYLVQLKIGVNEKGGPKYKNIYATTVPELERKIAAFKANLDKNIIIDDENLTLGAWATLWLETYKKNRAFNTYEMYRGCVNNHILKADVAQHRLSSIKTVHLQTFINAKLAQGLTRTVKMLQLTLNQIFKQAVKNELVFKNAAEDIEIPSMKKKTKRALSDDERAAISVADFTLKERTFVYIALFAGLRRGEILALTVSDIDFKRKTIKINKNLVFYENTPQIKDTPKTKAGNREVPMPDMLYEILLEYTSNMERRERLFTTSTGGLVTYSSYVKFWNKIEKKICVGVSEDERKRISCHILRHSYATSLYFSGVDVKTAQKLLGHESIAMTLDVYTHLEPDTEDVIVKMNDFLKQKTG